MTYCKENPSQTYRDLLAQHALVHAQMKDGAPLAPGVAFSGLSLFEQATRVKRLVAMTGARTIIDYGCGKGLQYEPLRIRGAGGEQWPSVQAYWGVDAITCFDPA